MITENRNSWIGTAEVRGIEQYEIDLDKIRSFNDWFLLFKAMLGEHVFINSLSPYYEDLKHLAKDEAA